MNIKRTLHKARQIKYMANIVSPNAQESSPLLRILPSVIKTILVRYKATRNSLSAMVLRISGAVFLKPVLDTRV